MASKKPPPAVVSWRSPGNARITPGTVGGKAAGLLALPRFWVPPFMVLGPRFLETWERSESLEDALPSRRIAGEVPRRAFERVLGGKIGVALLRSNVSGELSRPGQGRTTVVRGDAGDLAECIWTSLPASSGGLEIPLVQRAIEPALLGHMSNDRSVSRHPSHWLIEGELSLRGPELMTVRSSPPRPARVLRANKTLDLVGMLREVAGWLTLRGRFRVEWVWDGERVWIVQTDPATTDPATVPRRTEEAGPVRLAGAIEGDTRFGGRKVKVWQAFRDLALPTYPLLVLTGSSWREGRGRVRLEAFMDDNRGTPVVVRTDALYSGEGDRVLLPTSPPSSHPSEVESFIRRSGASFRRRGLERDRFAFLVSPLLGGEASALVQAGPGDARVRIDALWGYPDGVMNLPHDSYEVCRTSVESKVRFKPARLEATSGGGWQVQPNGEDADWAPTLSRAEALALAGWARRLADRQGEPVVLMAFTRLGGRRGARGCVPFWFGPGHHALVSEQSATVDGVLEIGTRADLKRLAKKGAYPRGFCLTPDPAHMRDPEFLRAAGELAARENVPIYFSGSVLGHPYYLLRSTGAEVIRVETPSGRRSPPVTLDLLAVVRRSKGLERVASVPLETVLNTLAEEQRSALRGLVGERAVQKLVSLLEGQAAALSAAAGAAAESAAERFTLLPRIRPRSAADDLVPAGPGAIPLFMDEAAS